jgi:DNA modification methylase
MRTLKKTPPSDPPLPDPSEGKVEIGPCVLYRGDCLEVLKTLPDNSVDSVVTDPPAGMGFMGCTWDTPKTYGYSDGGERVGIMPPSAEQSRNPSCRRCHGRKRAGPKTKGCTCEAPDWNQLEVRLKDRQEFINFLRAVMQEVYRVLKPGGHALVWAIPRTSHWTATACEDAGFEIRDRVAHIFGTGFPKNMDVSKAIDKHLGVKRTEVLGTRKTRELPNDVPFGQGLISSHADSVAGRKTNGQIEIDITAPATPEAAQWEGWGTALKPSVEDWFWCQKPLTVVPDSCLTKETTSLVKDFLWSLANAKSAAGYFQSNPSDFGEDEFGSAQWIAAAVLGVRSLVESEKMDMSSLPETVRMFWNIAWLWNSILGVVSNPMSTFTTLTASNLTTALKTLNSLMLGSTQVCTIQERSDPSGQLSTVPNVVKTSSGSKLLQKSINPSVAEDALLIISRSVECALVSIAESLFLHIPMSTGSFVQPDAITFSGNTVSPACEDWWLCRKPLEGTVAANVLKHGTGALNIDGCRVPTEETPSANRRKGKTPEREGGHWANDRRSPETYHTPRTGEQLGRFPANLIHDGSDEVLAGFPQANSARASGNPNNPKRGKNHTATSYGQGDDTETNDYRDTGSAARFFYCTKAAKKDRNEGGVTNKHPTVKNTELMQYLCRLITPPGGIVLDPFAGSFSTGKAAVREGFRFIGIEAEQEYFDVGVQRVKHEVATCMGH